MKEIKHCPECRQGCIYRTKVDSSIADYHNIWECGACGFKADIRVLNN